MPFLPALGSRLIVGGEDLEYDPIPEKVIKRSEIERPSTRMVVMGQQVPKTLYEHNFKNQRAPRGEVVHTNKTISDVNMPQTIASTSKQKLRKMSQYKQDLLTSQES